VPVREAGADVEGEAAPAPPGRMSASRRAHCRCVAPRRCDTGATLPGMPTRRRRHAITETPPVQAALDELRQALGEDRLEMGELVILGAQEKLARVRADRDDAAALRRRLADRVRSRDIPADRAAADEVRRAGWARP
jgi:hypothetical protein